MTLLLVDGEIEAGALRALAGDEAAGNLVYWSIQRPHEIGWTTYSISALFDENFREYRASFLQWIYDFGEQKFGRESLKQRLLSQHGDFSHWYTTLMAEKSPYKTPEMLDVMKLRVFEKLVNRLAPNRLVYCGPNHELHEVLKAWCRSTGRAYSWHRLTMQREMAERFTAAQNVSVFRHLGQALRLFLSTVRRSLRTPKNRVRDGAGATIVTYFPNVDVASIKQGKFISHYWESLHKLLDCAPYEINWVWLFVGTGQSTFAEASQYRDLCNFKGDSKNRYYLIEEFMRPAVFWNGFLGWVKTMFRAPSLRQARSGFILRDSQINFYPIFEKYWKSSIFGKAAMENQLWDATFDQMAKRLAARPLGLCLWEGIAWEFSLFAAWRRHDVKSSFAYQHAAVRPLDLRLFNDPRTYQDQSFFSMPGKYLVNGTSGFEVLREAGCPESQLAVAEAVRYMKLKEAERLGVPKSPADARAPAPGKILLVLCGHLEEESLDQLQMLDESSQQGGLEGYSEIFIKGHPFTPVEPILMGLKPDFSYQITTEPLDELLPKADVVYCANSTNAFLEALWMGRPVIVTATRSTLNLSPFFGHAECPFVSDAQALSLALRSPARLSLPKDYFALDESLPRWKSLLIP